ncbi:MAG: succinate dehydrogenase, hydrophobic membrane anchor protein [Gammaproteobacteria bacterium]|nr:MAG: succinate dehydrogenase, hydrophobic membrane anchor protein [Gammaproteobacteria bacterium]
MVNPATNYGKNGVQDWIVQRLTAVILAIYTLFIIGTLILSGDVTYAGWKALFSLTWVRVFSLMALLSVLAHAWVGLWTVSTDYIKPPMVRFLFQLFCGVLLFVYVVWGVEVLWGL